jgi:hypothetical protein
MHGKTTIKTKVTVEKLPSFLLYFIISFSFSPFLA